jgi:DNA-binding PadR family transcriptional regulator
MWDTFKNLHEKFHERIEEMQKLGGLRIWIIHVLDEGPKNGVEIMDSIEKHHEELKKHRMNRYHQNHHMKKMEYGPKRPSPGSVYPMLKKMVNENLIVKGDEGKYKLTDKGQEIAHKVFGHLIKPHEKNMGRGTFAVEHALKEIDSYVYYLEDVKQEKLLEHEDMLENLIERLKKIKNSLNDD